MGSTWQRLVAAAAWGARAWTCPPWELEPPQAIVAIMVVPALAVALVAGVVNVAWWVSKAGM